MWARVKAPVSDEPRWPLVPKLTRCAGSAMSGTRSKNARSSFVRSTRSSFGAGLPARGEAAIVACSCEAPDSPYATAPPSAIEAQFQEKPGDAPRERAVDRRVVGADRRDRREVRRGPVIRRGAVRDDQRRV